jgi:Sec-independent protein secretion pathway component TatC
VKEDDVEPETKFMIVGAFMLAAVITYSDSCFVATTQMILALVIAYWLADQGGQL